MNVNYYAGLQADWNLAAEYWTNLLDAEPLSYSEMVEIVASEHGA